MLHVSSVLGGAAPITSFNRATPAPANASDTTEAQLLTRTSPVIAFGRNDVRQLVVW